MDSSIESAVRFAIAGEVFLPPQGIWSNPKALGAPCGHSGGCGTGEPIDLGSGNFSNRSPTMRRPGRTRLPLPATTTACRPAPTASPWGTNWRHSYDRYLHILNPSAIYGVTAERAGRAGHQLCLQLRHLHARQRRRLHAYRFRHHMDAYRPRRHG